MESENPRPTKKRHLAAEERQRAVRACAECRRLKEKCEDGMPCRRCRHLRRQCQFSNAPATVEKRAPDIATSFKEVMDRLQCMEYILKHHFPNLGLDIDSLRRMCDTLTLSTTQPATSTSLDPLGDEQPTESPGIEDEDCTVEYVDNTTAHYSGEFSHWNFSMHIKRNIDELMARSNVPRLDKENRVPAFMRVGEADPDSTSMADIVTILPPRPVATFLINVFFKHATSIYYYVDRAWLDSVLDRIYANLNGLRSKDITAACVVLMVLAVGTQYVHLDSPRQHSRGSVDAVMNPDSGSSWELDIGSAFYRQVAKLLSEVIHSGSLLSVQVFLLLGLYNLPIDASGLGYIYLNMAIKLAIQNGMHRKASRSVFDSSTKEIRRRIWWTTYCMERKIGIYHGRPASIARSDIDVDLPKNHDTGRMNADSFNTTGLLESMYLTSQAEGFLHEISRLRTCAKSEVGTILTEIKHMKAQLRGSWSPSHHDPRVGSTTSQHERPETRMEIHCRLECCLLHMFIGRPFILAHRQVRKDASASPESSGTPRQGFNGSQEQWGFLVQDCVAAAQEAINICHSLQTGDMALAKSSYIEYSSCRASLLVLIAYSICHCTNEFSSTLHKGLEAIREMASVGDSARSEVSLIETLEAALHRLHMFDSSPKEPTYQAGGLEQDGYEGLVNWYTRLRDSAMSRGRHPTYNGESAEVARPQNPVRVTQPRPNRNGQAATGIPHDFSIENFPFDFDLLNSDGNVAFFTPDLNEHGGPERELFENLMWMPK
ncbi:Fungal trans multi-domain protein [Pyrenophora tritici-repentis]|uniref:Fungal specific transcription factor domain containing protein n=2 Tax=Pyrenophora tritici-repentis TaxID=45151 RepID=A0A922N262_9PLEO|nr:Fungal trans multi-domain protein [Pyrenophora tritici-repentis]KAI1508233.1 Fungal specific transcription factor domain containing protein [Pyrenophora tritici-repentis]